MKLKTTILIATLAAGSVAYAGHREAKPAIDPAVCPAVEVEEGSGDAEVVVIDDSEVVDGGEVVEVEITSEEGEVVEGEVTGGEVIEGEVEVTELEVVADGSGEVDPAVCEVGGPEVQRGGEAIEDPSVIFQTAFLGGVKNVETPLAKGTPELGQEDRAAAIEAKGAGAAEVNKEKKGPIALVKKGRVFLR